MDSNEPVSPDDQFEDSTDDTGTDGLVPEIDSVTGGTIQEPQWPAPNRQDLNDQRILNRVHNLRTMGKTNHNVLNHLKALGLDDEHGV